jgi:hypothetical protein
LGNQDFLGVWKGKALIGHAFESIVPRSTEHEEFWQAVEDACLADKSFEGLLTSLELLSP